MTGSDLAFRRSTYTTLGLAIAALGWAESILLPEVAGVALLAGLLLVVAFRSEGRWELPHWWSNVIGVFIAVTTVGWIGTHVARPDSLLRQLPWPTGLLPYVGPLLIMLIPAKLFRPKQNPDYWAIQGIGLATVGLGCAITDDLGFGLLFLLYFVSAIWWLILFYFRSLGAARSLEATRIGATLPSLSGLVVARRIWIVLIGIPAGLFALGLFMITPRSGAEWQLSGDSRRTETGIADDLFVDLNRTGEVKQNHDVAYLVQAEYPDGRPKLSLNPYQHWRVATFRYYRLGRWSNTPPPVAGRGGVAMTLPPPPPKSAFKEPEAVLPDYGDDQFFLTYTPQVRISQGPMLADPILLHPSGNLPVITIREDGKQSSWRNYGDGMLYPNEVIRPKRDSYKQVSREGADSDLSPPLDIPRVDLAALSEPAQRGSNIEAWTRDLLNRLRDLGIVPKEALTDLEPDGRFKPLHHEVIGRGLSRHLSSSGEFRYSLKLERNRPDLDPVEEFLLHSRTGHCNRYSSALVLMLRSLQIPAQLVVGYRSFEPAGNGVFEVRHSDAHSWVEVMVVRYSNKPAHGLFSGDMTFHWLSLDPTPGGEEESGSASIGKWWDDAQWTSRKLFQSLIVNYSTENRNAAWKLVWDKVRRLAESLVGHRWPVSAVIAVLALAGIGWRIRRTRWLFGRRAETGFYSRMLRILAQRGWRPTPSQTPREFINSLTAKLDGKGELASFLIQTTERFYRVRFGKTPLTPDELTEIEDGLRHLSLTL
jgi:hypothetical protein